MTELTPAEQQEAANSYVNGVGWRILPWRSERIQPRTIDSVDDIRGFRQVEGRIQAAQQKHAELCALLQSQHEEIAGLADARAELVKRVQAGEKLPSDAAGNIERQRSDLEGMASLTEDAVKLAEIEVTKMEDWLISLLREEGGRHMQRLEKDLMEAAKRFKAVLHQHNVLEVLYKNTANQLGQTNLNVDDYMKLLGFRS